MPFSRPGIPPGLGLNSCSQPGMAPNPHGFKCWLEQTEEFGLEI